MNESTCTPNIPIQIKFSGFDFVLKSVHLSIVDSLENKIQHQEKIIKLLKDSNSFYADKESWDLRRRNDYFQICRDDREFFSIVKTAHGVIGGKLAREIKQRVQELESEACL